MQDPPSSRNSKSDIAIGAIIGAGLFGTALGCGVIALGPLAIPIGIGAVLAGGVGGALFQNAKPGINETFSSVSSYFTDIISNIKIDIPRPTFEIKKSERIEGILGLLKLEKGQR